MRKDKIYKTLRLNLGCLIFFGFGAVAQEKTQKLSEVFKTKADVNIVLDAQHTNIIFKNWNKNEVRIEASLDTEDLDQEQISALKERWDLVTEAGSNTVRISSKGKTKQSLPGPGSQSQTLDHLVASSIAARKNGAQDQDLSAGFNIPLEIALNYNALNEITFDYNAYQREGDRYLQAYKQQISSSFGADYNKVVTQLQEQRSQAITAFAKDALSQMPESPFGNLNFNSKAYNRNKEAYIAILNHNLGTDASIDEVDRWLEKMELWKVDLGENFSDNMQEWSEQYAAAMERDFQAINENLDDQSARMTSGGGHTQFSQSITRNANGMVIGGQLSYSFGSPVPPNDPIKAVRTLIISMPSDARLNLDVRHGTIELEEVNNAQVKLAYGDFKAKRIEGAHTYLAVAYSPVAIEQWNYGTLHMSYVKRCFIERVEDIKIDSRGSNIAIQKIGKLARIRGKFGELDLRSVSSDFESIMIDLENTELIMGLPETPYRITYNGTYSMLSYPNKIVAKIMRGYDSQMLNGFYKSQENDRDISISSKFSEITLK